MDKTITVLAAATQDELEQKGADVEEQPDTIKEAKQRAKYFLTEEYRLTTESSVRLGYAQVIVNGKVLYDFEAKG